MKLTKNLRCFIFLTILISIGVLSLLPPEEVELGDSDKLSHCIAYLVLMVSFGYWKGDFQDTWRRIFVIISYGVLLEFLQGFVPGRVPSLYDGIANSIGVLIGVGILWVYTNKLLPK